MTSAFSKSDLLAAVWLQSLDFLSRHLDKYQTSPNQTKKRQKKIRMFLFSRSNLLDTRRGTPNPWKFLKQRNVFLPLFVALNFKAKPFVIKRNLMAVRFIEDSWDRVLLHAKFFISWDESISILLRFKLNKKTFFICSIWLNFFYKSCWRAEIPSFLSIQA
jgi:hypothetical protein